MLPECGLTYRHDIKRKAHLGRNLRICTIYFMSNMWENVEEESFFEIQNPKFPETILSIMTFKSVEDILVKSMPTAI